jgi:hypothetical protein
VRFYAVQGNVLAIRTEPDKGPIDGRPGIGIFVFEKLR